MAGGSQRNNVICITCSARQTFTVKPNFMVDLKMPFILSGIIVFSICSKSQKPFTANTLTLEASDQKTAYSIADLSWIAGKWRGADDSTTIEEHWMQPEGNNMLGMFRMLQGDKPLL